MKSLSAVILPVEIDKPRYSVFQIDLFGFY